MLAGCLSNVPVKTDRPSKHFEMDYVKTHFQSTKADIIQEMGAPGTILRSNQETYYVYEATGDLRRVAGIVIIVPPYFVPFFTGKEEDEAVHCLALTFDESGRLQGYRTATGAEKILGGVIVGFGLPAEIELGKEETACDGALWNEKELQSLERVKKEQEIRSLVSATPSDSLALWAYSIFETTSEGCNWLCRAADQGGTQSRIQIGNLFYDQSHKTRNNLIQAYVWYSLANAEDHSVIENRLTILKAVLSHEELQEARHRIESWKPNECIRYLGESGLLDNRGPEENLEEAIEPKWLTSYLDPFSGENHIQVRRMAEQGDTKAMLQLFWSIREPESIMWLCRAADLGDVEARTHLGVLYYYGSEKYYQLASLQITPDLPKSCMWFNLVGWYGTAEVKRTAKAMTNQEFEVAEKLIEAWSPGQCDRDVSLLLEEEYTEDSYLAGLCREADKGSFQARDTLGQKYLFGFSGSTPDLPRAYMWYRLAEEVYESPDRGIADVQFVCNAMTPDQRNVSDQLLANWKPGQCERDLFEMRK